MLFTPIKPMIVSMGREAFDDETFIFEPKWDGWRILLHKQGDRLEAYTRNGNVVTGKFPELREAAASIRAREAILDCEGVCIRGGRTVFDDFSYRGRLADPRKIASAARTHPASFMVFDVLLSDRREHLDEPLMTRKERLAEIVEPADMIVPTSYIGEKGKAMFAWSAEHRMEGIVAKRKNSVYVPGIETQDWIKIKHFQTIDAIVLGYRTDPRFGLVIGLHFRTVKYKPVGVVEFGFQPDEKRAFLEIARQLHTVKDNKTQWIEPKLVCRIQYLERTDRHQLRTTVFKGFQFDRNSDDCYWTY
ncbi:RNA ligase family protein [Paenibacillus humicola]|uniref:ATP-dependent DNA ligase n=1 Tax=Paenibacillus humicola TaxID=3110540 RepID=UPI00237BC341|nr:RNA ligase family protein [Paenibacillus humicola]